MIAAIFSHVVAKLHHTGVIRLDLRQMEGNVPAEVIEKRDPVADQDGQDRITNFVSQSTTQTFSGDGPAADKPDAAERRPESLVHEPREIARIELYSFASPRQIACGENEGRFVAVGPAQALGFKV